MANEITLGISITVAQGNDFKESISISGQKYNLASTQARMDSGVIDVATGATLVPISANLGTDGPGFIYLENFDPTNYVTFGTKVSGTFTPVFMLGPGEFGLFKLAPAMYASSSSQFWAEAHTATVSIQYKLFNQ